MKPQTKILLLLLVSLLAFGAYGLSRMDWSDAVVPLKKADLVVLEDTVPQMPKARDTAAVAGVKADTPKVEKDTAQQRILLIGDSMAGSLMRRFGDYAASNGHRLKTVTWASTTTAAWADCDTLDHYIRTFRPTLVVMCLGSNELFARDLKRRAGYAQLIVKKMGKVPFVWVSPPNWKPDNGLTATLREVVGDGRFFDSSHMELEREKDGAHPTPKAAAKWMDEVAAWLGSPKTAHPIRMDRPTQRARSYDVVIMKPYKGKR